MSKKLIFVSGLPRSGSTLLCNLLAQNPRVHAAATSAVFDLCEAARNGLNSSTTVKATPPEAMEKILSGFLRGAVSGAYDDVTDRPVVAEKSRAWVMSPDLLFHLLPDAKILVPVRDLRGVLASLEKKFQSAPHRVPPGYDSSWITLAGRVQGFLESGLLKSPLHGLKETSQRFSDRVHFVHAEDLTKEPEDTMQEVWDYLGEDFANHDFADVEQYVDEIDVGWPYGDHHTKPSVEPIVEDWDTVLGRKMSDSIKQTFEWVNRL